MFFWLIKWRECKRILDGILSEMFLGRSSGGVQKDFI